MASSSKIDNEIIYSENDDDDDDTDTESDTENFIPEAEIYKITCNINDKTYIGATKKYMGKLMQKWGGHGRWVRHCRDAFIEDRPDYDCELHKAIREYGKDSFTLKILCSCDVEDLDEHEKYYIKKYNSIYPNGYNMTEGGKDGKHCDFANEKKKGKKPECTETAKENMSKGQIGKRYEKKERKNEEDKDLPKYVYAIRKEGKIVGYQVKKFPMGIETPEYIYKTYKNKNNIAKALQDSIAYVKKLEKEYEEKLNEYNESKIEQENIEKIKLKELPEFMYYLIQNKTPIGYYVKGMKDYLGNIIPKRDFKDCSNIINYSHAVKFIKIVNKYNNAKEIPDNWLTINVSENDTEEDLPHFIRVIPYKGENVGYRVDYYIGKTESGEKLYERKSFSSKKLSMSEKLQQAIDFVKEMGKKHTNTE